MSRKDQYRVRSLEKALDLLNLFSQNSARLTATEIAEKLNTRAGTIYPTLKTLEHYGYLERDEQKRYRLGLRFLEKGRIILAQLDIRELAQPHLKRLAKQCQANAHLAILNEWRIMYLHREEGYPTITLTDIVGRTVPAYCTALGKVLLAYLDENSLSQFFNAEQFQALTPNTITDRNVFLHELERTRERGYAVDNEEFHEGVMCVAAPVHNYRTDVVAAVSISLPRSRISDQSKQDGYAEHVLETARRISQDQGYTDSG